MKNIVLAIALAAIASSPASVAAQADGGRSVAGAASGVFASDAALGAIPVRGLELGTGVLIEADGSAAGTFYAVLHAVAGQSLVVEAKIAQGSIAEDGSVTFTGSGTLDLGDGTAPAAIGWLNVSVAESGPVLSIDSAILPFQVSKGTIAVE